MGTFKSLAKILADDIEVQPDGCWYWLRAVRPDGYGHRRNEFRRGEQAHRYIYRHMRGPIPDGMTLDHLCHTTSDCPGGSACMHRRCVNPGHMEPVSMWENLCRGNSPIAGNAFKTHCPKGHPYDEMNTYHGKRGRFCRACGRETQRRYQERKRAS